MQRKLYVTSKEFTEGRILIGVLTELEEGSYQFEYKLGGEAREWHLPIREFPDVTRVYNGQDVDKFIDRLIPKRDSFYIAEALESVRLSSYDSWEMLKAFGKKGDSRQETFLFEDMPERTVVYEPMGIPV